MRQTAAATVAHAIFTLFTPLACNETQHAAFPPSATPIAALPERYNACAADPAQCRASESITLLSESTPRTTAEITLSGPLAGAPAVRAINTSLIARVNRGLGRVFAAPASAGPSAPQPVAATAPVQRELIDLEARLTLEVRHVPSASARVRALTLGAGGQIVNETFEDNAAQAGAALSLRVPSEHAAALIQALEQLGTVRSFSTQATDVSRKLGDAETVFRNLELERDRYRELLNKAANAHEMVEIEKELDRVATAIERVKTDLEWMRDRVARSTLYVSLTLPAEEHVATTAKLYPGLRAPFVLDLPSRAASAGYLGGGLELLFARTFNLDFDLLTNTSARRRDGVDLFLASAGAELYSNLLGAGHRKYFNPYLGFRAGYAHIVGRDALLLGGSLGLELVKSETLIWDLQARGYATIGSRDGTHVLLQPALVLNLAY